MNDNRHTENLTIHHKVKDYAAWRKGYDDHEKARGIGQHRTTHEAVRINPADLDATLEKDRRSHDGFAHSPA